MWKHRRWLSGRTQQVDLDGQAWDPARVPQESVLGPVRGGGGYNWLVSILICVMLHSTLHRLSAAMNICIYKDQEQFI